MRTFYAHTRAREDWRYTCKREDGWCRCIATLEGQVLRRIRVEPARAGEPHGLPAHARRQKVIAALLRDEGRGSYIQGYGDTPYVLLHGDGVVVGDWPLAESAKVCRLRVPGQTNGRGFPDVTLSGPQEFPDVGLLHEGCLYPLPQPIGKPSMATYEADIAWITGRFLPQDL